MPGLMGSESVFTGSLLNRSGAGCGGEGRTANGGRRKGGGEGGEKD